MSRNYGGQKRTVFMPCGKIIAGHPREVGSREMLHIKYCSTCSHIEYHPTPFQADNGNDRANIKMSRHGNITKAVNKTVHAVTGDTSRVIQVDGVATAEQSHKAITDMIKLACDEKQ